MSLSIACIQALKKSAAGEYNEVEHFLYDECVESRFTSSTPLSVEIASNNFCLASVCFCNTNVVPYTITMVLYVLSNYQINSKSFKYVRYV